VDVLYPVRKGDWNDELRYSLRSLQNIKHDRVFLVGYKPSWAVNVITFPREQKESKYLNANKNLIWAADHAELSDPFLLLNDDFYIMQRVRGRMPMLHMGPVEKVIDRYRKLHHTGVYWRGMKDTFQLCRSLGMIHPLSYELHVPMILYKGPLQEAWDKGNHLPVCHIRTLYGNVAGVGGTATEDCKVYSAPAKGFEQWPFLSSTDNLHANSPIRKLLEERFPDRSPYESA
jgi:hypothetical protein